MAAQDRQRRHGSRHRALHRRRLRQPGVPQPSTPAAAGADAAPRFRISLHEHRVYDLEEARKFCSERCLVASAAFAASLPSERPYGVPPDKLDAVAALVEGGAGLGFGAPDGKKEEEEGRKVKIREKEVAGAGEVALHDWIGRSDAIEEYVPCRDRIAEDVIGRACWQCQWISGNTHFNLVYTGYCDGPPHTAG
ncbi:hypothetical protein ACP70R_007932 [Stipagrostis hirtigluma subsp. patula]